MRKFINSFLQTHWQWYRNYFKVTYFRYLVPWFAVVPVIANLIIDFPEKLEFQTFTGTEIIIPLELPFTWELLWLSSLFFVIAFAIYKVFCPNFITKYYNFEKYLDENHSPRWIVWESKEIVKNDIDLSKFVKRLLEKKYLSEIDEKEIKEIHPIVKELQTVLEFNYKEKTYSLAMPILDSNNNNDESNTIIAEKEIFWEVFGRFATSRYFARVSIIVCLILSFGFFLIVLFQNIIKGLLYTAKVFCS